jgi:UDP-glucose 4-epimerase
MRAFVTGPAGIIGSTLVDRLLADGHQVVGAGDHVYVDDVVDAFVRAGRAPTSTTGTYNIGTGQRATATDVRRLISAVLDGSSPPRLHRVPHRRVACHRDERD